MSALPTAIDSRVDVLEEEARRLGEALSLAQAELDGANEQCSARGREVQAACTQLAELQARKVALLERPRDARVDRDLDDASREEARAQHLLDSKLRPAARQAEVDRERVRERVHQLGAKLEDANVVLAMVRLVEEAEHFLVEQFDAHAKLCASRVAYRLALDRLRAEFGRAGGQDEITTLENARQARRCWLINSNHPAARSEFPLP